MSEPLDPAVSDPARLAAVRATGLLDTDPEAAFDDLAALAAMLLDAPFAFVTVVDDTRSFWKARIGLPADAPRQNTVQESFCQYVVASGEPLMIGDTRADPRTADNPSIVSAGVAAWAGFPLTAPSGQTLGSFCVLDSLTRQWTERDVEVLRVLSRAASREIALRAAYAGTTAAAAERDAVHARLQLLGEISASVSQTLQINEAVTRLARLVVPLLGDWSIVSLVDDSLELKDIAWWHVDDARLPFVDAFTASRLDAPLAGGSTAEARRTGRAVVVASGALDTGLAELSSPSAAAALVELAPESAAVFPLLAGRSVVGTLTVMRDAGRAPMSATDLEVGTGIGLRVGMALETARLYSQQRQVTDRLRQANARLERAGRHARVVARALQDAMLTRLPEPEGIELVVRYLTAESADQVGGDWYDAIVSSSGGLTLVIGDVAGHDIDAATVMGQLRNMLRAFAWNDAGESPAALIARLDRAMNDLGIDTMATLAVLRLAPPGADGRRAVRYSSAGHPPVVLIEAGAPAVLLGGRPDMPLGVDVLVPRHDHMAELGAGATLLLYTDGLVETRECDYDHRTARLLEIAGSAAFTGPDLLADTVLAGMVGTQPTDDVAVLVAYVA